MSIRRFAIAVLGVDIGLAIGHRPPQDSFDVALLCMVVICLLVLVVLHPDDK